jgi:DNA-binding phage protein
MQEKEQLPPQSEPLTKDGTSEKENLIPFEPGGVAVTLQKRMQETETSLTKLVGEYARLKGYMPNWTSRKAVRNVTYNAVNGITDPHFSTLSRIVNALGGRIMIIWDEIEPKIEQEQAA